MHLSRFCFPPTICASPLKWAVSSILLDLFFSIAIADVINSGLDIFTAAQVMIDLASHSWEWGTGAEALLELYNNELSVFGPDPFPNGQIPQADPFKVR
jgi:hypothetical protein